MRLLLQANNTPKTCTTAAVSRASQADARRRAHDCRDRSLTLAAAKHPGGRGRAATTPRTRPLSVPPGQRSRKNRHRPGRACCWSHFVICPGRSPSKTHAESRRQGLETTSPGRSLNAVSGGNTSSPAHVSCCPTLPPARRRRRAMWTLPCRGDLQICRIWICRRAHLPALLCARCAVIYPPHTVFAPRSRPRAPASLLLRSAPPREPGQPGPGPRPQRRGRCRASNEPWTSFQRKGPDI